MKKLLLGLALMVVVSGCGKKMDVLLRHPLQVGVVDQPNTIEARNGWQSTLMRLDPEAVCFDVNYSIEQPHGPPDAALQSQRLLMKAGDWYDDAQIAEVRQPQVSTYMGRVAEQRQQGWVQECVRRDSNTNQCLRWEERPRYVTVMVPATFYRADAGGVVCFPNQGRVTLQSDRVVFQINRVNFRWGLEDQTAPTAGGENEG